MVKIQEQLEHQDGAVLLVSYRYYTSTRAASPGAPIKEHYYKVHLNEEVNLKEHQDQDWEQV